MLPRAPRAEAKKPIPVSLPPLGNTLCGVGKLRRPIVSPGTAAAESVRVASVSSGLSSSRVGVSLHKPGAKMWLELFPTSLVLGG